jgi:hypothetical protein
MRWIARAAVAGLACAAGGAWAGQQLGNIPATAGAGLALGAVSGAFAPTVAGWLLARARAQEDADSKTALPLQLDLPSRLLDPRRGVVSFTGRSDELKDLAAWCADGTGSRLWLMTGPGGVGKTRLALRFAEYAQGQGWRCQWVGSDQEARALASIRAVTSGRVLLIIDYAETRTGLPELLRAAAADRGKALRLLLLARTAGAWWEELGAGEPAVRDMVTAAGLRGRPLRPAVDSRVTDEELIRQAIPFFARELNTEPPADVSIVPGLRRARMLELHAAALVAVLDSRRASNASGSRVDLGDVLGELLRHEERFWLGTAKVQGLLGTRSLSLTALRQIVALGCLLGAADEDEALALLRRVPRGESSLAVALWLQALYPPEPESGEWLGSLQPDRLAEHHTVLQLGSSEAFARMCVTGLNERQARRAILLLARAATEQDEAGELLGRLLPLLSDVVSEIQAPPEVAAAQYRHLVTQYQDLRVLRR